jgi:hypothetical protein
MAVTFEQLYKQKLKANIITLVSSQFDVIISNDINIYASGRIALQGDEILGVLTTGNGSRSVMDNIVQITQPLSIEIYVKQEYTQSFLALLTNYVNDQSGAGVFHEFYADTNGVYYSSYATGRTLYYTAYLMYNTPFVNPSTIDIGSSRYQQIMLVGTVLYADISLTFGKDFKVEYSTNNSTWSEIKNVADYQWNSQLLSEQVLESSKVSSTLLLNGDTVSCSLILLKDSTDTVHQDIVRRAFINSTNRGELYFRINYLVGTYRYTFVGRMRVNLQGGNSKFSTMTVAIIPSGTITETANGV